MEVHPILGQHITMSENMWVSLIALTIASTSYKNCFHYTGVL